MSRFFFHVVDETRHADIVGAVLSDSDEARRLAVQKMSEILARTPEAVFGGREVIIAVTDHDGQEIFRVAAHAV